MTFLKCSNSSLTKRDSSALHVLEKHFGKVTKPSTEAYFYPTAEFYFDFCSASQMGLGDLLFLFIFFSQVVKTISLGQMIYSLLSFFQLQSMFLIISE